MAPQVFSGIDELPVRREASRLRLLENDSFQRFDVLPRLDAIRLLDGETVTGDVMIAYMKDSQPFSTGFGSWLRYFYLIEVHFQGEVRNFETLARARGVNRIFGKIKM